MKKRIVAIALIVLCLSLVAGGTLAYYTKSAVAHNVITSGSVDIAIEEWQKQGDKLVPYPDDPISIMPGDTVSKIATVKNNDAEAFIRAKAEIVITDEKGKEKSLTDAEKAALIALTMNTDDWQEKDGWWYYSKAVPTGTSTTALFTEAAFSGPKITNEYQNCTFEIVVHAQGVQTANNGTTALEANGWPK